MKIIVFFATRPSIVDPRSLDSPPSFATTKERQLGRSLTDYSLANMAKG